MVKVSVMKRMYSFPNRFRRSGVLEGVPAEQAAVTESVGRNLRHNPQPHVQFKASLRSAHLVLHVVKRRRTTYMYRLERAASVAVCATGIDGVVGCCQVGFKF